jgi:hypothetical protein
MQDVLDTIRGNASNAAAATQELLEIAGALSMDLSGYWTLAGLSADVVVARSNALIEGARGLAEMGSDRLLMAPTTHLTNLRDQLDGIKDATNNISNNLSTIQPEGIASYEQSSGVIAGKNGTTLDVRALLDALSSWIDKGLDSYLVVANVAQPRGIGTYSAAARTMTKNATDSSEMLSDLRRQAGEFAKKVSQLEVKAASLTQAEGEAQRLVEEIAKARRTADENEQRILAALTAADESRSKAAGVDAQVQAYEDQFKAFQSLLDVREAALKQGNADLATLQLSLADKDVEATALVGKAAKMLGGATIAGLSSTYHSKAQAVDGQLLWARGAFYSSVGLLLVSVILALNLTTFFGLISGKLPPIPTISANTPSSALAIQTLAALGSRVLVVLPALLLAGFASHRHSTLFRLREEYSHKETLAVSVQGFKEQAPTYEEPIAAAVFQELLSNPATSMDKVSSPPEANGFVQRLITPSVEKALKSMLELRDGALANIPK